MFTPELVGGHTGKGHGRSLHACIIAVPSCVAVSLSLSLSTTVVMLSQIIVPQNADRSLPALVASSTNFGSIDGSDSSILSVVSCRRF
jgi:hypothetical protein